MISSKPTPRVQVLDAFRALAIIAVILFHTFAMGERERGTVIIDPGPFLYAIFSYGWIGVQFFFIISGFVIFMTLSDSRTPAEFLWRRFARIWPGYIASVLVITAIVDALHYDVYRRSAYDLLVAPALWAPLFRAAYISGVYWSLVVELRFYVTIAVLYFGLGAARFPATWLGFSILAALAPYVDATAATHLFSSPYLPFFSMGIVFHRRWTRQAGRIDAAIFAVALVSMTLQWGAASSVATHGPAALPALLSLPLAFWLFVAGRLEWLATPPLLFFGRISYALYLLHFEISMAIIWRLESAAIRRGRPCAQRGDGAGDAIHLPDRNSGQTRAAQDLVEAGGRSGVSRAARYSTFSPGYTPHRFSCCI